MVREAAGSQSPIVHVPYSKAYTAGFENMQRRVPDVSKLERTLGFKPTTTLEKIVVDVVDYQRSRIALTITA